MSGDSAEVERLRAELAEANRFAELARVKARDEGRRAFRACERANAAEARIAILETNNARLTEVSMTRLRALQALNQPDPAPTVGQP